MAFFGRVKGRTGRLVRPYDAATKSGPHVLTEFQGWLAISRWDGTRDADYKGPGATLNVDAHEPDSLVWGRRTTGALEVELDIGGRLFTGPARILGEEPLLTIEITGALESR